MPLPNHEELIPPGLLIAENKIGSHSDPAAAEREFREYGRLQMEHWVTHGYVTPASHVLDVGCGLGRVAQSLPGFLTSGTYTGIDVTKSSTDWCSKSYRAFPNFRFIHANLSNSHYNTHGSDAKSAARYSFPVDAGTMDFIWSTSLFTHMRIEEVDNYLGEMTRVAKQGTLIWNTYFILDDVSEPLARAGIPGGALRFPIDGGLYMTEGNPDHVIAFYLDRLRELHEKHGLEVVHVGFGGWCGRPGTEGPGQDVIVARKR
jgi:ubiquinone/menaquinone biosynthesis C-methylase UbiE